MINLYVDESGSMTTKYTDYSPHFIIAIVHPKNARALKSTYRRFVKSHMDELREADKGGKMFANGKFKELKGSEFTPALKKAFVDYFCRDKQFQLFYIVIDNKHVGPNLYKNTARGFNYCLKLALAYFMHKRWLPTTEDINIQIDERNQKTNTKSSLQEYLNN
ncbi:MAG: DUF3800 domain-containing protein, partial [Clostridia bacterium]|nr:DUF3800 domain-containing protein [Clostridia bacterium]